ncbi:MAG: hypothetical protein PHX27_03175 [Candidatus ainarchaeum sp.]|nr:hypothetical protein [Candidatus ainarchaeum sp.]
MAKLIKKKLKSSSSKYSNKKILRTNKFEDSDDLKDFDESSELDDSQADDSELNDESGDDFSNSDDDFDDTQDSNFNDSQELIGNGTGNHLRSHGLFNNIWWKKGMLKGFSIWVLIVIIFYIFEFFGLVDVIGWKRWGFFLIFLMIIGLAYEKFLSKKLKI